MAETIKDFLVSLGWEFDENKQKRFVDAMRGAEVQAKLLADALEALARKAAEAVAGIAETFDRLYFSTQRTGASAATIRDFGYAVKQLGGSAEGAQASLEAMGQKLRENPGNIAYLNALGLGLNRINGQLEIQVDKLSKFQQMPMAVAEQYRSLAGMDERTFLALRDPQLLKYMQEAADARKRMGFDPDQAAKDANDFMTTWRRVGNDLGVIADDIWTKLMKALDGPLQEFQKFIETNSPAIKDAIDKVTAAIGEMTKAWVDDFEKIIKDPQSFNNFREGMHNFASDIAWLAEKFHTFITDLQWLNEQGNKVARVLNNVSSGGAGGRSDPSASGEYSGSSGGGGGNSGPHPRSSSTTESGSGGLSGWWKSHAPTWLGGTPAGSGGIGSGAGGGGGGGGGNKALQSRAIHLMDRLVKVHGWTPEAAAIAAGNAQRESNILSDGPMGDPGTPGGSWGMFQWNRERLARLKEFAGERKANWQDTDTQIDFFADEANRMVPEWKSQTDLSKRGPIGHAYEGYAMGPEGYRDEHASTYLKYYKGSLNAPAAAEPSANGPVVFGDSIAEGLKDYGHTQGSALHSMSGAWVTDQIKRFGGDLKGRKIVLSSGASNSHDPNMLAAQIYALRQKGVDPKDIIVLGVGDRGDFAGYNDTLSGIAKGAGASFVPIHPGGDHVHPESYKSLWHDLPLGTSGDGGADKRVSVNSTNHFHIDGAGDPHAAAQMVAKHQTRLADDMTLNMIGAVN